MLSDKSLSLSGSLISLDISDLFFKIDFDLRFVSSCGEASMESIDSDNLCVSVLLLPLNIEN